MDKGNFFKPNSTFFKVGLYNSNSRILKHDGIHLLEFFFQKQTNLQSITMIKNLQT